MQITDEDVVRTLREVVAERPDHVYVRPERLKRVAPCLYVHPSEDGNDAECGCLVAHVLNRLGVGLWTLAEHEGTDAEHLIGALRLPLSDETVSILADAQAMQDCGEPWAKALEAADEAADERREEAEFNEMEDGE